MEHLHGGGHDPDPAPASRRGPALDRLAFSATAHCLSGCAIGEVFGMAAGTALGWTNGVTVGVSVVLAFLFGYLLTLWPLLRAGMAPGRALGLTLASDTLSIVVMEVIDNAVMLVVPGAMGAALSEPLFWGSLALSLVLAGIVAFPVNRWLIARGMGHAVVHVHHRGDGSP